MRQLKTEAGKDIYVFGSADLLASLLENGLVDEYRLCIAPVLLGRGNPLFKTAETTGRWPCANVTRFPMVALW